MASVCASTPRDAGGPRVGVVLPAPGPYGPAVGGPWARVVWCPGVAWYDSGTMNLTRNPLAPATRAAMVDTLNVCLANAIVLSMMAKQAHWNVRGIVFGPLHGLFDDVYEAAGGWADDLAERAAALGGEARGTPAQVLSGTTLTTNAPLGYEPETLCTAVAQGLAAFSAMLSGAQRLAGGEAVVNPAAAGDEAGVAPAATPDLATQDVFITMQREVDKMLWKVEASMAQHRG